MRKHQQKQILELLQTLGDAHSELRKNPTHDVAVELLANCQDFALVIGGYIEEISGEDTQTVSLLEEYCELLFNASIDIKSGNEAGRCCTLLEKQLIMIENSVKNELKPNRVEIVFISYKASMSDSLESIYLAAKADSNCDAYWIPVPYFEYEDREAGTIRAMHFEGSEYYPDYIECTDWQKYSIQERRPDAIFTFNPYDEKNRVTSIHPDYYCRNLRNLTDMLVYVPYYIVGDAIDDHFCLLPGCIYAHRVVLQSEKIRETYIQVHNEMVEKNCGNPYEKFVALGSPKFDKVLNSKRKDFTLPAEWKKLLVGKKAVLFNTGIAALLQNDVQYLIKLRNMLDAFRLYDDAVLWWRPHPLTEATYRSMRPMLLEEYRKIVDEYKAGGWGIFDDSPDLHRAIAWTDAYYGDPSSMTLLFGIVGKHIMIANQSVPTYEIDFRNHSIASENFYDDGEYLWFSAIEFNALLRINKTTREVGYMGSFPKHDVSAAWISRYMAENTGKLYFAPYNSRYFYVYDIFCHEFEEIIMPPEINEKVCLFSFFSVVSYKNFIFYVGYMFRGIVRYDVRTGESICFDKWIDDANAILGVQSHHQLVRICAVNNKLYCPFKSEKAILVFDMDTGTSKIYQLDTAAVGFRDLTHDGTHIWLVPQEECSYLVKWIESSNELIEYENPTNVREGVWNIHYSMGYVWCFPSTSNISLKINIENCEITVVEELVDEFLQKMNSDWIESSLSGNTAYLHKNTSALNSLITYDIVDNRRSEECIHLSNDLIEHINSNTNRLFLDKANFAQKWQDFYLPESLFANVVFFTNYIVNKSSNEEAHYFIRKQVTMLEECIANPDGTSGEAIYAYIMKYVFE